LRKADRYIVFEVRVHERRSILHSFEEPLPYKPATSFLKVLARRRGERGPVERIPDRAAEFSAMYQAYVKAHEQGSVERGFLKFFAEIAARQEGFKSLKDWGAKR
jgi:hypothetical protein